MRLLAHLWLGLPPDDLVDLGEEGGVHLGQQPLLPQHPHHVLQPLHLPPLCRAEHHFESDTYTEAEFLVHFEFRHRL